MVTIEKSTATLDRILAEVAKGQTVEIRRNDIPVAMVSPVASPRPTPERIREALDGLSEIQARNTLGGISLKSLIEEGRP